jgi:peptidyl-tRNA hydrolase, PTH1 family
METFVYIGLGNNGPRFNGTRHNLGIETLRTWVQMKAADESCQVSPWHDQAGEDSQLSVVNCQEFSVDCLFPTTMMNDSGRAVAAYLKNKTLSLANMVVIHDDVELPLGEVRLTVGGSAKGHNGVRSIQQTLGSAECTRLRLGVGRPPEGTMLNEFVLEKFLPEEKEAIEKMTREAAKMLTSFTGSP